MKHHLLAALGAVLATCGAPANPTPTPTAWTAICAPAPAFHLTPETWWTLAPEAHPLAVFDLEGEGSVTAEGDYLTLDLDVRVWSTVDRRDAGEPPACTFPLTVYASREMGNLGAPTVAPAGALTLWGVYLAEPEGACPLLDPALFGAGMAGALIWWVPCEDGAPAELWSDIWAHDAEPQKVWAVR